MPSSATIIESYLPSAEKLLALGFGMPARSFGPYHSVTYFNIDQTKAVVVWPDQREVRLAVRPAASKSWSDLYTGIIPDEETFNRLLIVEAFIFPEQL